jgi:alkylation response protein AidB-like acyl-CoA dehydrogenase
MARKIKGGDFLMTPVLTDKIMIPEYFTDEQKLYYKTARGFLEKEVLPLMDRIQKKEEGLMPSLLKKAGEQGLLMADIPEKYDGLELDKVTSMILTEGSSLDSSFSVSLGAHTGIGTLPIVFFGNEQQKAKYLPKSSTGEWLFAYALTEPDSGSDALGAKTKAVLSEDGKYYTLNGVKQYITNAGFADVFVVFAKVDGEKFTGFIVEKEYEGVSTGLEEHKMGINGSSTRQLILEDCKVPVENVLGIIGKGHKIAFNILNFGRFKLGAATVSGSKAMVQLSVQYAKSRKQFKKFLYEFSLIQEKITNMYLKAYVSETMSYRVAGMMDDAIHEIDKKDPDYANKFMKEIEEYSIEDSIMKIIGSEYYDNAVDETMQIHGGNGYIEDYQIERFYRDSRINRIFEGTNEINRLLIPGVLLKRAMKNEIPLLSHGQKIAQMIKDSSYPQVDENHILGKEIAALERAKIIALIGVQEAVMKYQMKLIDEQELLSLNADIVSEIFVMDSVIARASQVHTENLKYSDFHVKTAQLIVNEGVKKVLDNTLEMLRAFVKEEKISKKEALLNSIYYRPFLRNIELKREICATLIEKEKYFLTEIN